MKPSATVVCIGEILWNVLPAGRQPGGAPFNAAVYLHQLGLPTQLVSRIGDDELGRELLAVSTQRGLNPDLIQRSKTHLTGVVKANVRSGHQVLYKVVEPVAWDYLRYTAEAVAAVSQAQVVVYGSLVARNAAARETLYRLLQHALFRVFDVNLRPPHYSREVVKYLLRQATLVKLNSQELTEIMGWLGQPATEATALPWLAGRFNIQAICVTKGAGGATLWTDSQFFHCPSFDEGAPLTIGSGDAFLAALVASQLQGRAPADCLRRACAAAALVARQATVFPTLTNQAIDALAAIPADSQFTKAMGSLPAC